MFKMSMLHDPWEPLAGRLDPCKPVLTSVEISVTGQCNLRCEHCAVGYMLVEREPERIPAATIMAALDRVETLTTISITGGEPTYSLELVDQWLVPLLNYARRRGLTTQLNTNLTFDLARYRRLAPLVDIMHITWNYCTPNDFKAIAFPDGRGSDAAATRLFSRIQENAAALAAAGHFVSAETMISPRTAPDLGAMNRMVAAMGCRRHEIHPRYPVDFAEHLTVVSLDETAAAVERLLAEREPSLWVLFGTFPFFLCDPNPARRQLVRRVLMAPNVTIRNDPDGKNRLNVDAITGDIRVTDFADFPDLGNILAGDDLMVAFDSWQVHPASRQFRCECPAAHCSGPNPIVAATYYPGISWTERTAVMDSKRADGS